MSIYTIDWYDEQQTIILITVNGRWSWLDAYEAVQEQQRMMSTVETRVSTIFDLRTVSAIPRGALPNIRNLITMESSNEDMTVMVSQQSFIHMMINMVGKVYRMKSWLEKYRFVSTMEEAVAVIRAYQEAHPPSFE